ncbi:MAG: serine hydrolase domain-containing protein [Planctomycetota bacterium]
MSRRTTLLSLLLVSVSCASGAFCQPTRQQVPRIDIDQDRDGLPDPVDRCPSLEYEPGFDWSVCAPSDANPGNDPQPECKARERVLNTLLTNGTQTTHIAFAVVKNGQLHFADAFVKTGPGQFHHDPDGIRRLCRVGSTSKPILAFAAKFLEEFGTLSLSDWVSDEDGSQVETGGKRQLRHLLSHQGAFKVDNGAIHLFGYPGSLLSFWAEPNDLISPHYDSAPYGNLGGGYEYSAFNYSLAGAYVSHKTGAPYSKVIQSIVFDSLGMCTATFDADRAVRTSIGNGQGVSESGAMHVGPFMNLVSPTDPLCADDYYSSDDLYGDPYSSQIYRLDETDGIARHPAGGVIASVLDIAHFAESLLASYHGTGGLLSPAGVRELWGGIVDLGCGSGCAYERYYGLGFFTDTLPGQPVHQVGHGGSRAGYASAFVLRPEANLAVSILANSDVSTILLSDVAKAILDDFEGM